MQQPRAGEPAIMMIYYVTLRLGGSRGDYRD